MKALASNAPLSCIIALLFDSIFNGIYIRVVITYLIAYYWGEQLWNILNSLLPINIGGVLVHHISIFTPTRIVFQLLFLDIFIFQLLSWNIFVFQLLSGNIFTLMKIYYYFKVINLIEELSLLLHQGKHFLILSLLDCLRQ